MPRQQKAEVLCLKDIFKDKYVIPLYQRNFTWGEEQITRLMQDIYESMIAGDSLFFLGSLVVIERAEGMLEVIDGQQRLTMLSILAVRIGLNIHTDLHYDSRPEVEEFFKNLQNKTLQKSSANSSVIHFYEALDFIESAQLDTKSEKIQTLMDDSKNSLRQKMAEYIRSSLRVVREIMPEDTDVAAYFEIMNNRGEQLQEHEIIKGLMLGKLHEEGLDKYISICSEIWDACSQMDIRIQRSFKGEIKEKIFGQKYDRIELKGRASDNSFGIDNRGFLDQLCSGKETTERKTLEDILKEAKISTISQKDNKDKEQNISKEESIIDFPNFLMHIFKLFYKLPDNSEIPLSDKFLLGTYGKLKNSISPVDFFLRLLYCRFIFDRYMVKSEVTNNDQSREWTLDKAKTSEDNKANLYFVSTFEDKQTQQTVIYALSCLQVSFRQKPYKNFLQEILSWFTDEDFSIVETTFIQRVHKLMLSEFERSSLQFVNVLEYDSSLQGTNISHYLFNFADYLYWTLKKNKGKVIIEDQLKEELKLITDEDFRFLNRNSIEHHYPQNRKLEMIEEGVTDFDLNCLGNLYLISKSANSRLSDKAPTDKAALNENRKNLPPTRQIIYALTRNNYNWGINEIKQHFLCIKELLDKRTFILIF